MASLTRTRPSKTVRYNKVIYLIGTGEPYQNEWGSWITPEVKRKAFAQLLEIGGQEFWTAATAGNRLEYQFELSAAVYKGELKLEYKGQPYTIVRHREGSTETAVRLVCEKKVADIKPSPAPDPGGGGFSD